jgi:outer membrane immunogenic protein
MRPLISTAAVGATILAFAVVPGRAADLRVPISKAPPAVATSWTGFYFGLGVGARSTLADATVTSGTLLSPGGSTDLFFGCGIVASCVTGEPLNGTSARLSSYLGYNWQIAPRWVVGVEGDIGWASRTTTLSGMVYPGPPSFVTANANDSFAIKTTWDASARGRVGYLADPAVLIYATGGAAWLHVEATAVCDTTSALTLCGPPLPLSPGIITNSTTRTGWTLGGGLETAFWGNWILRAEYRYADFGTFHNVDTRTRSDGGLTDVVAYDVRVKTHLATFGVAYKFGDSIVMAPAIGPARAPLITKAAVAPLPPSWTGPYLGLGVGTRASEARSEAVSAVEAGPAVASDVISGLGEPLNNVAFRISPYFGYNWQVGPQWLVGIEGDWGSAGRTTTLSGFLAPGTVGLTPLSNFSFALRTTWDASARARVGYLLDPALLVYATGGATWLHADVTSICDTMTPIFGICAPGLFAPVVIAHSTTRTGWTVGGGLEAMLARNWFARAEYRYADFGSFSNTNVRTSPALFAGLFNTVSETYSVRLRTHMATFGLAYKFDGGSPVVARY